MTDDLGRLAAAIRNRRTELGLSARAVADHAGVSRGTWVGVEIARTIPQRRHHAGIERALGWTPGSIAATLDGGEPTIAGDTGPATSADLDERLVAEVERISRMPIGMEHRLRLIRAVTDAWIEDQQRAGQARAAARPEPERGGQREAS